MNIVMEYADNSNLISNKKWDIAFYGRLRDNRCEHSVEYLQENSKKQQEFYYDAENYEWYLNNENKGIIDAIEVDFATTFHRDSSILIDATSLDFAELLILLRAFKFIGVFSVDFLYLEPAKYRAPLERLTENRCFDLSIRIKGFLAILGYAMSFESQDSVVVLCGYEGVRLGYAFEDFDIRGDNCRLIFGMPPYSYGWDMNSYVNFLPVIKSNNISTGFYYCSASNPLAVYETLKKIYTTLDENQNMFILPFGTKPMSLGAVMFIIENAHNNNISILYDHPIKTQNSTSNVIRWNLYKLTL